MTWKRVSPEWKGKTYLGADGISPNDVKQGYLGNCWFLAACSAVAEYPNRLEKNMITKKVNEKGIYGFNFWLLGVPHSVYVDDYIPRRKGNRWLVTRPAPDNSLWPLMMEKAMAKMQGNYAHLNSGKSYRGIRLLRGGPFKRYEPKDMTLDAIWDKLAEHFSHGDIVTASSMDGSDADQFASGVTKGHAFSVLGSKRLNNGDRVVIIRDPHGKDYAGNNKYNNASDVWTPALLEEIPDGLADDGKVYLPIETFKQDFDGLYANINTENMKFDYYLALDEKATEPVHPTDPQKKGVKHSFKIVSTEAQRMWVGFTTYDHNILNKNCGKTFLANKKLSNAVMPTAESDYNVMMRSANKGGSINMDMPYGMKANEYLDFNIWVTPNPDGANDWSIVAWGEKGPVYVYEAEGKETKKWTVHSSHR